MMGSKKASEIKRELRHLLSQRRKDVEPWLDRQIAKLQPQTLNDPRVAEDLLWVRKMLRTAEKKTRTRKSRNTKASKTPAS